MRRVRKTNLEHKANRLRGEIRNLCRLIEINLDCTLNQPEDLPIAEVDSQFDELKAKWGELAVCKAEISRLEAELK
jgi:hypothetical protein